MKNRIIALAAMAVAMIGMISCTKNSTTSSNAILVGSWTSTNSTYEESASERTNIEAGRYTITFKADSTYVMKTQNVVTSEGHYLKSGSTLTMGSRKYTIDNVSSTNLAMDYKSSSVLYHYVMKKN